MPAAIAYTNGDQKRGVLELAGHPTRYSQKKVRGVRKRRRHKLTTTDRDPKKTTRDGRAVRDAFNGFPLASNTQGRMAFVDLRNVASQDRVQQLIKVKLLYVW